MRRVRLLVVFLSLIGLLILAAFAVRYVQEGAQNADLAEVRVRLITYRVAVRFEQGLDTTSCGGALVWAEGALDKALACHRQSPTLDAPFRACLEAEDLRPS